MSPPIVFLARGGSGSRLLSVLGADAGIFLGNSLNVSGDALELVPAIYEIVIAKHGRAAESRQPPALSKLRHAAYTLLTTAGFPACWGFKLPESILIIPEIMAAFPNARFVHLIRDPATTCLRRTHLTARIDNEIGQVTLPLAYRYHELPFAQIAEDSPALHMAYTTRHQLSSALEALAPLPPWRCLELRFEEMISSPREVDDRFRAWLDYETPRNSDYVRPTLEHTIDARRAKEPSVRYTPEVEARVLAIVADLRTRLGYPSETAGTCSSLEAPQAFGIVDSVPPPAAFIVGVPRSGTTLLRMMLDSHPEIAIPPETHFYFEVIRRNREAPLRRAEFCKLLTRFFSWRDFGLNETEFAAALQPIEPFNVTAGLRAFHALYARRFGKSRWGEKTPDYGNVMAEIEALLPEAHFVHIIRDGRDVALSRRPLWFGPGEDILAQAEDWLRWIMRAREIGSRCAHYMEVRYDDLLARPADVLREVCEFLRLPFRAEMLAYHETAGRRLEALQGWPQLNLTGEQLQSVLRTTTKPLQLDRVARWKREMSRDDAQLFEEIAGPVLQELGFDVERNGHCSPVTSPAEHRHVVSQNPSVTALLLTDGISAEAFGWFSRLRAQVDELVIWVDVQKASPETEERARQLATRIHHFAPNGIVDPHLEAAAQACRTDWILRVDSDEELSPEWDRSNWRELLQQDYTNFALPRRWLTAAGRYIAAAPWWPDYQVRLFRNTPSTIHFPTGVHGVLAMAGRGAHSRSLALHHHVLRTCARAEREEKVRFYQTVGGPDLGHYYLFEDYSAPQAPLPPPQVLDPETEFRPMGLLYADEAGAVSIEIKQIPERAEPVGLFWVHVQVTNSTERTLSSAAPFPVHLSYHWLERTSGRVEVFDGQRTALLPALQARSSASFHLFVVAPSAPGDYLLEVTLVQEGVRWLEQANPAIVQRAPIDILATIAPRRGSTQRLHESFAL